jgi:hypothetical protein
LLAWEKLLLVYPVPLVFASDQKINLQFTTKGRSIVKQAATIWRLASISGQYVMGLKKSAIVSNSDRELRLARDSYMTRRPVVEALA